MPSTVSSVPCCSVLIWVFCWFASRVFCCFSRVSLASVLSNRTTGCPARTKLPSGMSQEMVRLPEEVLGVATGVVSIPTISPLELTLREKGCRTSLVTGMGLSSAAAKTLEIRLDRLPR